MDYRASAANAWRRHDLGEDPLVCSSCRTEIDVEQSIHSPHCHEREEEEETTDKAPRGIRLHNPYNAGRL